MEIISLCPFRVGTLLWEAQPGQPSLSITVKATLNLVHGGEAVPAPENEQVDISSDLHWDKNGQGSIYRPSDIAPLKRRVDVILSGHAYAPGKVPVESLVAKLRVGDLVKSVRVTGDRCWTKPSSGSGEAPGPLSVGRPLPFLRMPLRYERAPQSPDNPIGIDPDKPPALGQPALPNLELIEPEGTAGFGPVASTWPARRNLLSEEALAWASGISDKTPIGPTPSGFNFEFFNVAPREQQIELLRAGTLIQLEGLSPAHPHLETTLPALRPQVFRIHPGSGRPEEIILRCDTLWIDSDHGIAVLSFRGLTDVDGTDQGVVGKLIVAADPQGKRLRFEKIEKQLRDLSPESLVPITSRRAPGAEGVDPLALRYDGVKSAPPARAASGSSGSLSPSPEGVQRFESLAGFPPAAAFPADRAPSPIKDDDDDDDDDEYDQTQTVGRALQRSRPSYAVATPPAGSPPTGPARLEDAHDWAPDTSPARLAASPLQGDGDATQAEKLEPARAPRAPAPRTTEPPPPLGSRPPPPPPLGSRPPPPPPPPLLGSRPPPPPPPPPLGSRPPPPPPPPLGSRPPSTPPPSADLVEPISVEDIEELDPDAITAEKPTRSPSRVPSDPPSSQTGSLSVSPLLGEQALTDASSPGRVASASRPPPAPAPGDPASPPPPGRAELESELDPGQIPIERYATVSAELAQKGAERSVILRGYKFTIAGWASVDRHWTRAIAEQTERGERALLSAFDAAYVATQERLRRPIGVAEYARILVGLERGEVGRVLAELELQLSDLMRLQRVWAKKLTDTPELAAELQQATEAARRSSMGS